MPKLTKHPEKHFTIHHEYLSKADDYLGQQLEEVKETEENRAKRIQWQTLQDNLQILLSAIEHESLNAELEKLMEELLPQAIQLLKNKQDLNLLQSSTCEWVAAVASGPHPSQFEKAKNEAEAELKKLADVSSAQDLRHKAQLQIALAELHFAMNDRELACRDASRAYRAAEEGQSNAWLSANLQSLKEQALACYDAYKSQLIQRQDYYRHFSEGMPKAAEMSNKIYNLLISDRVKVLSPEEQKQVESAPSQVLTQLAPCQVTDLNHEYYLKLKEEVRGLKASHRVNASYFVYQDLRSTLALQDDKVNLSQVRNTIAELSADIVLLKTIIAEREKLALLDHVELLAYHGFIDTLQMNKEMQEVKLNNLLHPLEHALAVNLESMSLQSTDPRRRSIFQAVNTTTETPAQQVDNAQQLSSLGGGPGS